MKKGQNVGEQRKSDPSYLDISTAIYNIGKVKVPKDLTRAFQSATASRRSSLTGETRKAKSLIDPKLTVPDNTTDPKPDYALRKGSDKPADENLPRITGAKKASLKKDNRKCVHIIYDANGVKKRCRKKKPSVGSRRPTPPTTADVKEPSLQQRRDKDLIEAKRIGELKRLSRGSFSSTKSRNSTSSVVTTGSVPSPTITEKAINKSTLRKVELKQRLPKLSQPNVDKRYKPHSSFNAVNRWSTLQSTLPASTSTSRPSPSPAPIKQASVLSPSMATTIDDSLMLSDAGSVAPPNSSNTSGSKSVPRELKSRDLSGKRRRSSNDSNEPKPVPTLKLRKSGNDYYLGFSAETKASKQHPQDALQRSLTGRNSTEPHSNSNLEQDGQENSESPVPVATVDEMPETIEQEKEIEEQSVMNRQEMDTSGIGTDHEKKNDFEGKDRTNKHIIENELVSNEVISEKRSDELKGIPIDGMADGKSIIVEHGMGKSAEGIVNEKLAKNYSTSLQKITSVTSLENELLKSRLAENTIMNNLTSAMSIKELVPQKSVDGKQLADGLTGNTEISKLKANEHFVNDSSERNINEQFRKHDSLVSYLTNEIENQELRDEKALAISFAEKITDSNMAIRKSSSENIASERLAGDDLSADEINREVTSANVKTDEHESEQVGEKKIFSANVLINQQVNLSEVIVNRMVTEKLPPEDELAEGNALGEKIASTDILTAELKPEQVMENGVGAGFFAVVPNKQPAELSDNISNAKLVEKLSSIHGLVDDNPSAHSELSMSAELIEGTLNKRPHAMGGFERVISYEMLIENKPSMKVNAKEQQAENETLADISKVATSESGGGNASVNALSVGIEREQLSQNGVENSFLMRDASKQFKDELPVRTASEKLLPGSLFTEDDTVEENLSAISTANVDIPDKVIANKSLSETRQSTENITKEQFTKEKSSTDTSEVAPNELSAENISERILSDDIRNDKWTKNALVSNLPGDGTIKQPANQHPAAISIENLSLIDELAEYNSMEESVHGISKDNSTENQPAIDASKETVSMKSLLKEIVGEKTTNENFNAGTLNKPAALESATQEGETGTKLISVAQSLDKAPIADNTTGILIVDKPVVNKSQVEIRTSGQSVTYKQAPELDLSAEVVADRSHVPGINSHEVFPEVERDGGTLPTRLPSSPEPLLISSAVSSKMEDSQSDSDEQDASIRRSSMRTSIVGKGSLKSSSKDNSSRSEKDIDTTKRFEPRLTRSRQGRSSLSGNHDVSVYDQSARGKVRHSSVKSTDLGDDDRAADKKNFGHRQRSVKFSHTTVVGGSASERGIFDLHQGNNDSDDAIVNVMDRQSPPDSHTTSPQQSAHQANLKSRRFSIETHSDPLGYGMSSFLSARDSLEMKKSLHGGVDETDKKARAHLSQLITEINAGKLEQREIRRLTNFAQKLLNAHAAGEVIGKHNVNADEFEILVDATPTSESGISRKNSLNTVTDNVNSLISEIRQDHVSPVHMADLALAIVEACSRNATKMKGCVGSICSDSNRRVSENLLSSLQSSLRRTHNGQMDHGPSFIENTDQVCRVKFDDEPESLKLIRVLHKLKAKIVLAPTGGSFTESIEKVINDVGENQRSNLLYDAMILSLCLIVSYQEWQNVHSLEKQPKKQVEFLTKFDVLAHEVVVALVQKVTSGISANSYTMEELLRLTALISGCDFSVMSLEKNADGRKCSIQPEPLCKQQEEIVLNALCLIKRLLVENHASLKDLNSLALAAYELQSKTTAGEPLRGWGGSDSIWSRRRESSKLIKAWSFQSDMANSDNVEISFITHFRLKLNGLQESFGMIDVLAITLKITELALDALARESSITDFWAASLVLAVALIFDRIKSEMYSAALDYKVLDSLVSDVVYEAFNVAIQTLQADHIDLPTFQFLTSAVTKHRLRETTLMTTGMSPKFSTSCQNFAASVSSPYAVIDFLENALVFMRRSTSLKPGEIKALGDYALGLQHFYGCEMMARIGNEKTPNVKHWPTQPSLDTCNALAMIVTPELILEHLDGAITLARRSTISDTDLLTVACFVAYLVELPEKLAQNEPITLPSHSCFLMEYEQRLLRLHKITHFIPRFDFVIQHLEKVRLDLKNQRFQLYNHDLNILCLCIFVAYEWVRPEPLTVFAAAKLDSRAAVVVYETIQSTLHGIKTEVLSLDNLKDLAYVISNTTDLRRASAVDVSNKVATQVHVLPPDLQNAIDTNDRLVLALVDGMVHEGGEEIYQMDMDKLKQVLTSMQNGTVSNYLYELLVLSVCTIAGQRAISISEDVKINKEFLASVPKPNPQVRDYAVKVIKQVVDGLRSGQMEKVEAQSIIDMMIRQTNKSMVDKHQIKSALRQKSQKDNLWTSLNTAPGNGIEIMKTQDTAENAYPSGYETSARPSRVVRVVDNPEVEARHFVNADPNGGHSRPEFSEPVSRRSQLLQELCKDAMNKLAYYIEAGLFDECQLQNLSDIIYQLAGYKQLTSDSSDDSFPVSKDVNQVLTTATTAMTDSQPGHRIHKSEVKRESRHDGELLVEPNTHVLCVTDVFTPVNMPKTTSSKNRAEWTNAQAIVINGLETKQYSRDEMEILSHALTKALQISEPETEPVKEVELHGMMGKKPLHFSSDFLGETLSGFSIRPDGVKRYSYRSLVNPDLARVEGLTGTPERQIGRRLSMQSEANIGVAGLAPFGEEERSRRRSSIPQRDFILQGLHQTVEEEGDEDVDEVWEASMHEVKVTNSIHHVDPDEKSPAQPKEKSKNKNNSSCVAAKDEGETTSGCEKETVEQKNNNASVRSCVTSEMVVEGSDINKSPPSLSEGDTDKQVLAHMDESPAERRQKADVTDSESSICPEQVGECADSFESPLLTQTTSRCYPRPSKPGGAKIVKKVVKPKVGRSGANRKSGQMCEADEKQTVAEKANSLAKAMSRKSSTGSVSRSKAKPKKTSTFKGADAVLSAYSVSKKVLKK